MNVAEFRAAFPAFADEDAYTDDAVSFWLDIVNASLDAVRWGTYLPAGQGLFVAHHLTLNGPPGGGAGSDTGLLSSKTVGQISAAYDTLSVSLQNAGHWNQTKYGRQFIWLVRLFGIGGVQL